MKKILFFVSFALVLSAFLASCKGGESGVDDFRVADTTQISKILITGKKTVSLEKINKKWMVNAVYPAYMPSVKRLMQVLADSQLKGQIPSNETDSALAQINKNSIEITVFKGEKQISSWKCGYFDELYNATTAEIPGQKTAYLLYLPGIENDLQNVITDNNMFWMTAYVFDYEYFEIQEVGVSLKKSPEESFKLKIEKDTAFLSDFQNKTQFASDLRAVGRYLTYFKAIKFDSLIDVSVIPQREPDQILKLTDRQGKTTKLDVFFRKLPGGTLQDKHKVVAAINDTTAILMRRANLDLLLKKRSYFQP